MTVFRIACALKRLPLLFCVFLKKICYGGGAFNVACNIEALGGRF